VPPIHPSDALGLGKISFCNFGISEGPKLQNCKENCKKLLHCPGTVCCLEGVRLHTCTALGCYVCTYDHFHAVFCTCESPTKQHPVRRPNRREVATTTTLSFSPASLQHLYPGEQQCQDWRGQVMHNEVISLLTSTFCACFDTTSC
jgi:hypothetical protein